MKLIFAWIMTGLLIVTLLLIAVFLVWDFIVKLKANRHFREDVLGCLLIVVAVLLIGGMVWGVVTVINHYK